MMIARLSSCDDSLLRQMVDGSLPLDTEHAVAEHLNECTNCQARLETLTSVDAAWQDTKEALAAAPDDIQSEFELDISQNLLAASKPSHKSAVSRSAEETDRPETAARAKSDAATEHWVQNHLEPSSDDGRFLGTLDGIPIRSVVGQGGMGVVLRAHDAALNRELAIKLLSPMLASIGTSRQRFFREAQAAAAVVHPNIVPIYAVSEDSKLPYLSMPYVSGGNLQQLIQRDGQQDLARVLSMGLQVAEGLSAAHAQGIVHRDIKPANLMLDGGGFRVMLTDFGLARALDDSTLTCSGMISGTPQYMSPEQASGRTVDHRSDIYSLGAVLYALATGRPPVTGESSIEVLRRVGDTPPTPVVDLNESYPAWFDNLLAKFMAPEVDNRIQSANECCALLREVLAHVRSPGRVALPPELLPKHPLSRRQIVVWPMAAAIFMCIGFLIASALGPASNQDDDKSRQAASGSAKALNASDDDSRTGSAKGDPSGSRSLWTAETPREDEMDWMILNLESDIRDFQYELAQ